jgi:hypothetical protein
MKKINLQNVLMSLDAVCPKCGKAISPAEVQRVDFKVSGVRITVYPRNKEISLEDRRRVSVLVSDAASTRQSRVLAGMDKIMNTEKTLRDEQLTEDYLTATWDGDEIVVVNKDIGGHLRYTQDDLEKYLGKAPTNPLQLALDLSARCGNDLMLWRH